MNRAPSQYSQQPQYVQCPRCGAWNYQNVPQCHHCGLPFTAQPVQYQQQQYYQQAQQQPPQAQQVVVNVHEKRKLGACAIIAIIVAVLIIIIFIIAISSGNNSKPAKDYSALPPAEQTVAVQSDNYIRQTVEAYPLLGAEYKKISDMTDIQKTDYLLSMIGKEYRVVGDITEVNSDGTIQLQLKNSTFMAISIVRGFPQERLKELTKDDIIDFIGRVSNTDDFLYIRITTDFVRDTEKY